MISVIVLAPDSWQNTPDAREIVARSLSWLVSAVVAGIVRDVSLAASPALNLGDIAVHVGCDFVEDDDEATRLHACAVKARCAQVLVVKAGFQPTGPLADELEAHGRLSSDAPALLLATPTGFAQNLIPNLAPVVGILATKQLVLAATSFAGLARVCRQGSRLATRAKPFV